MFGNFTISIILDKKIIYYLNKLLINMSARHGSIMYQCVIPISTFYLNTNVVLVKNKSLDTNMLTVQWKC